MSKLSVKAIRDLARAIISETPGGIRYSTLVERIYQQAPGTLKTTIESSIWNLETIFPNEITRS
jgi:hypothetical protein